MIRVAYILQDSVWTRDPEAFKIIAIRDPAAAPFTQCNINVFLCYIGTSNKNQGWLQALDKDWRSF